MNTTNLSTATLEASALEAYTLLRARLHGFQKLALLGAGSVLRADDAAGVRVAERLRAACPPEEHPELLCCIGETAPENFSGKIRAFQPTHLLVIDAADIGTAAGALQIIPPEAVGGPTYCSHMLPLKVMLSYLAAETGCAVTLLGIQYKSLTFDGSISSEVENAVTGICAALQRIIAERNRKRQ